MTNPQPAPAGVQTVWAVFLKDGTRDAIIQHDPGDKFKESVFHDIGAAVVPMAILPIDDLRLAPEAGWRAMDSAPKDGSRIFLGNPKSVGVGHWQVIHDRSFWMASGGGEAFPTHWMPLPPPPAPETKP